MLQLGNAILHVRAPVIVAPDLLWSRTATGDEDAEGVARHFDQLAAHAVAALAHPLANDHEAPLGTPALQLQAELTYSVVVVQDRPLLHSLSGVFHPPCEPGHYNVGQQALLQEAQQLVVKEARIGSQQADFLAQSPECESFFEKLLHAAAGPAVAATKPAVEEEVSLTQHRQQRMVAGTTMFARVVSFERTLLLAVTFQDR